MIKSQFLTKNVLLVAIFTILVFSPMTGEAATSVSTVPFDTLSISEKITYLSALVAQVQTDLNRANYNDYYRYNNFNNNSYNVNDYRYNYSFNNEPYRYNNNDYRYSYSDVVVMPGNRTSNSNSNDVDVETTSATNIEDDEADLRGRLDLEGERSAEVWFEYGEDDDDLDERTNKKPSQTPEETCRLLLSTLMT